MFTRRGRGSVQARNEWRAAESEALLDHLCRQADYPEYRCRFRWEDGSVVF